MRSLWIVLSLAGATCQRVDEPSAPAVETTARSTAALPAATAAAAATSPPNATATTTPAPAATSTTRTIPSGTASAVQAETDRCIEQLVEPPPPRAEPASICPHDPEDAPPALRHGKIRVPAAKGSVSIDVEIADTPATEQRGLMYRTALGADAGMIFVWPSESIRTFWMHNTCLPLDMLFLAKDGTVVGLLEQVPVLNDRPRQVR